MQTPLRASHGRDVTERAQGQPDEEEKGDKGGYARFCRNLNIGVMGNARLCHVIVDAALLLELPQTYSKDWVGANHPPSRFEQIAMCLGRSRHPIVLYICVERGPQAL